MASRTVSVSRTIAAPAARIFDVLADPTKHAEIDGSGSVKGARAGSTDRLRLGSNFGMSMRIGVPYPIRNEVVEFEEGRRIAWQHFAGHRWRYELEPVDGGTRVTETFDGDAGKVPKVYDLIKAPERNREAMEKTLERLEAYVTTQNAPA